MRRVSQIADIGQRSVSVIRAARTAAVAARSAVVIVVIAVIVKLHRHRRRAGHDLGLVTIIGCRRWSGNTGRLTGGIAGGIGDRFGRRRRLWCDRHRGDVKGLAGGIHKSQPAGEDYSERDRDHGDNGERCGASKAGYLRFACHHAPILDRWSLMTSETSLRTHDRTHDLPHASALRPLRLPPSRRRRRRRSPGSGCGLTSRAAWSAHRLR